MPASFYVILVLIVIIILVIRFFRKKPMAQSAEIAQKKILEEYVLFYQKLTAEDKQQFIISLRDFLSRVRITGVKTEVDDLDKTFVGAAAIIPVFRFKGWKYNNINEVLIYPESFDHTNFAQTGEERHTLGVVGNGPLQNVMILSRHDLRNGFMNHTDKSNTAIHEFVHLVDKDDGEVDGMPETLLPYKASMPWIKMIQKEIAKIHAGNSDINPYGSTNEAEFFAVAAEYFFERPELMEEKHPELFKMLQYIFVNKQVE